MIDVVEILQHRSAGRSKSQVAASLDVDRGRVRKAPAEASGVTAATQDSPLDGHWM